MPSTLLRPKSFRRTAFSLVLGAAFMVAGTQARADDSFTPLKPDQTAELAKRIDQLESMLRRFEAEQAAQNKVYNPDTPPGYNDPNNPLNPRDPSPNQPAEPPKPVEPPEPKERELSIEQAYMVEEALSKRFTYIGKVNERHVIREGETVHALTSAEYKRFKDLQYELAIRSVLAAPAPASGLNALTATGPLILPTPESKLSTPALVQPTKVVLELPPVPETPLQIQNPDDRDNLTGETPVGATPSGASQPPSRAPGAAPAQVGTKPSVAPAAKPPQRTVRPPASQPPSNRSDSYRANPAPGSSPGYRAPETPGGRTPSPARP